MQSNDAVNVENNEKQQKFAEGKVYYFDSEYSNGNKPSLYFDGNILGTQEHIKRNIKISKYFKCYDGETKERLYKNDYPDKDKIYSGKIQIETWEWDGHSCMRVLALEVGECHGINKYYKNETDENPFTSNNLNYEREEALRA